MEQTKHGLIHEADDDNQQPLNSMFRMLPATKEISSILPNKTAFQFFLTDNKVQYT
jgi:hypothetical protein